jgi:periplasmic protein TonB
MFDRYVQGTKPSWKRRAVLTVSLALHAIAAIVLVVYSFVHVEEITPPALSLTFFSAPPPPPPPPPPAKKHTEVKHIEKKIVTPTTIPQLVQPKQEEEKNDDDGEEGGVEGGVAGGVKGGVVGGVVGGTGTPGPPPKAKNVPPHQLEQQKISGDLPHLPDIVKIQRKGTGEAVAMVKICIDQGGRVNQVSIIQGIPGADSEILSTVRSWKYKPQAIPICSMVKFEFSIN